MNIKFSSYLNLSLSRRRALGIAGGLGAAVFLGQVVRAVSRLGRAASDIRPRTDPLRLRVNYPRLTSPVADSVRGAIAARLAFREGMSFSDLLHWIRVFAGPEPAAGPIGEVQARQVIADFTDPRRLEARFGAPSSLVESPNGARYLFAGADGSLPMPGRGLHAYQVPAIFGEAGIPSTTSLALAHPGHSIASLLNDCLANLQACEVSGVEPEWAAIALGLYLPPEREWINRWEERLDFDALAGMLLGRTASRSACGGTHAHFALAVLMQANRQYPILGSTALQSIEAAFRSLGRTLARTQRGDGSWDGDWGGTSGTSPEEYWTKVHITGHIMEYQALLPRGLQVETENFVAASRYLAGALLEASDDQFAESYCPYSHAGRFILKWPTGGGPR